MTMRYLDVERDGDYMDMSWSAPILDRYWLLGTECNAVNR